MTLSDLVVEMRTECEGCYCHLKNDAGEYTCGLITLRGPGELVRCRKVPYHEDEHKIQGEPVIVPRCYRKTGFKFVDKKPLYSCDGSSQDD